MANVLFCNEILRDRPTFHAAAEDQLRLKLPLFFEPGRGVRVGQIILAVMSNNFQQGFISAIDVFEFEIKDGIYPVFAGEYAKAILPSIAGEEGG